MKYIKNKPVRDLTSDQFLKLTLAEEENLLTIIIQENIDGITSSSYIDEVKQLYIRVRKLHLKYFMYVNTSHYRMNLVKMYKIGMQYEPNA